MPSCVAKAALACCLMSWLLIIGGAGSLAQTLAADAPAGQADPAQIPADQQWAFHAQTTFTEQYHPAFASAYRGPNSLDPGSRGDETWDVTLYGGVRPWRGGEIWVNPEVDQGFGLSNTVGVAAFPSAEAYKVGEAEPYVRVPRLFFRQTLDLGGAVQGVDPDLNQLGGSQTANRLVLWVGKFGVPDVFDANRYAHDPRNDFLDWGVVDGAAFDYAADAWGFTYGSALEWYQDFWSLRTGVFDGSTTPNSKFLALPLLHQFQLVDEIEVRYTLFGQDGRARLLGYMTRAKLATFAELEAYFAANPGGDIVTAEVARHLRNKFGGELNFEQAITADIGAFLRASMSDGRTEAYDFTDVDRSLSLGLSASGTRWNRPDDTAGLAGVIDNITKEHKDYFETGDLGILIGDGRLTNAGPEQILETYYSFGIRKGIELTADYQFINHPAYNRDRGPVSILGARLHAQF